MHDNKKISIRGIHILSGLKRKKIKAIIIAKGKRVICSAKCWAKYLKKGFNGCIRYGEILPKRASSSKVKTTQTTENCLTKKALKKYLESIILLKLIDSFKLLFVHILSMKNGIIPDIAHKAISTLYSNIFEYWTFNKVTSLFLFKLDIYDFLLNKILPIISSTGGSFIYKSSISKLLIISLKVVWI